MLPELVASAVAKSEAAWLGIFNPKANDDAYACSAWEKVQRKQIPALII